MYERYSATWEGVYAESMARAGELVVVMVVGLVVSQGGLTGNCCLHLSMFYIPLASVFRGVTHPFRTIGCGSRTGRRSGQGVILIKYGIPVEILTFMRAHSSLWALEQEKQELYDERRPPARSPQPALNLNSSTHVLYIQREQRPRRRGG